MTTVGMSTHTGAGDGVRAPAACPCIPDSVTRTPTFLPRSWTSTAVTALQRAFVQTTLPDGAPQHAKQPPLSFVPSRASVARSGSQTPQVEAVSGQGDLDHEARIYVDQPFLDR